jgi:hypothetical protein
MTLSEFLLALAADPHLLERFQKDPVGVADELGLTEAQRRLLGPGQLDKLRVEIRAELKVDDDDEAAMIIWLHHFPSIPWLFAPPDDAA